MRLLLILLVIAAVLTLNVNAAAITKSKRAVSASVQTFINYVGYSTTDATSLGWSIQGFMSSSGYTGALSIHQTEQTLENDLKFTISNCNFPMDTFTDEEASAVLSSFSSFVPSITQVLDNYISRKPLFDKILLATALVKTDIRNLNTEVNIISSCMIRYTPASYLATGNSYVSQVNSAFSRARSAYGI